MLLVLRAAYQRLFYAALGGLVEGGLLVLQKTWRIWGLLGHGVGSGGFIHKSI